MLLDNNCSCISCSEDLRHPGEKHHCNGDVHLCAKGAGGQRCWECWSDRRWTTDTLCCTYKVLRPYNWWFYIGHLPPICINWSNTESCLYLSIANVYLLRSHLHRRYHSHHQWRQHRGIIPSADPWSHPRIHQHSQVSVRNDGMGARQGTTRDQQHRNERNSVMTVLYGGERV